MITDDADREQVVRDKGLCREFCDVLRIVS